MMRARCLFIFRKAMASLAVAGLAMVIVLMQPIRAAQSATPSPQQSATEAPTPPLTIYPRAGNPHPSTVKPHGPGLLLMGGGDTVDASFQWMHDVIAGSPKVRAGDIVVLRASGGNDYDDYLIKVAAFNSAQSIKLGPAATTADLAKAASYVDRAQGVFFAGGDQANYARWKDSSLIAAVQRVYDRGGVVGGTSAGLAILGEYAYDSVAADAVSDETEVTTKNALADPAEPIISFTHDLLIFPPLRNVITDTHFKQRDRFGRLAAFLAILQTRHPAQRLLGVGVDAASAIVIDKHGIGTLKLQGHRGSALFVSGGQFEKIVPGKPLAFHNLQITLLNRDGQTFDFNTRCAHALHYAVDVDGKKSPSYDPADPYEPPAHIWIPDCKA